MTLENQEPIWKRFLAGLCLLSLQVAHTCITCSFSPCLLSHPSLSPRLLAHRDLMPSPQSGSVARAVWQSTEGFRLTKKKPNGYWKSVNNSCRRYNSASTTLLPEHEFWILAFPQNLNSVLWRQLWWKACTLADTTIRKEVLKLPPSADILNQGVHGHTESTRVSKWSSPNTDSLYSRTNTNARSSHLVGSRVLKNALNSTSSQSSLRLCLFLYQTLL